MNLAKALKRKNRLTQKISNLQVEIQCENSTRADNEKKIDVEALMKELTQKTEDLIKLKLNIFVATTPVREHILKLGELKAKIAFLRGITTAEGKHIDRFGDQEVEYVATYDKAYIKTEVESCENKIDELQEELDKFNYTTEIEI